MTNNNYKRGRAFEYRVMALCEKAGYNVTRASGSHGQADIIAIKSIYVDNQAITDVLFIQCKYGSKASKKEREALFALDLGPHVDCIIAWSEPKKPIVLSNKHGVFTLD